MLDVARSKCQRPGRPSGATLIAEHGADQVS